MNLNIIGNGFDLYHGLPSSYYYFGCYLVKENYEFYEEMGKMYNLKYLEIVGPAIAHDYIYIVEDIFWSNFEAHLGEIDEYFIVETSTDDLGLEFDDPVEIELHNDYMADRIKSYFSSWVSTTIDVDSNYDTIKKYIREIGIDIFNPDDYYLQFNYTHTLQELYNVSDGQICYIHGECFGDEDDDLIVGHGNDDRIKALKTTIEMYEESYDYTQKSCNRKNEYECLLSYVQKLRKDVNGCKEICKYFYNKFDNEPACINVIGLSLGDVDIPYLKDIRLRWPKAYWNFSYFSESDEKRIDLVADKELNLQGYQYTKFHFSNELVRIIIAEIIKKRKIECI